MGGQSARGKRRELYVSAALAMVPVILLGAFSVYSSAKELTAELERENLQVVEASGHLISQSLTQRIESLAAFARRPGLQEAFRTRDRPLASRHLEDLVLTTSVIDRAFVTDLEGVLWADHPHAPESLGRSFADRDWFLGVSKSGEVYVSEVYRRHAAPQPLLVAIATPVHGSSGEPTGYVVCQILLEGLSTPLRDLFHGDGRRQAWIADRRGNLAAHSGLDLQERLREDYAQSPPFVGAMRDGSWQGIYQDPVLGVPVLTSALRLHVDSHDWVVVAQHDEAAAYAPIRFLGLQILGAVLLASMIVGVLTTRLARAMETLRRQNLVLGKENLGLSQENLERKTALTRTEELLRHSQRMELVGRLAGGVAHDFNNVLSVILGYSEMLLEELGPGHALSKEVGEIHQATGRASAITRQLLALSRQQVLAPRVVDLSELVRGLEAMLRRVLREDIQLELALSTELGKVFVDPVQLEQVLLNLVVNARDAMAEGGTVMIQTSMVELDEGYAEAHPDTKPGPHVLLSVTDTGCGMDAAVQERLFEPYFTTKPAGKGTGLGLAIVHGIVKQSGGHIWVYSEPGQGTTFKIYLPILPATHEESVPTEAPSPPPRSKGGETILLVEDNEDVRHLIERVLDRAGYRVLGCPDAETAMILFEENLDEGISLLVTDVVLPGKNGRQLADALRARMPSLKVLFTSGYTDDMVMRRGILENSVEFLPKPFSPRVLLERVHAAIASEAPRDKID